jgi:hypothetical protein
MINNKSIGLNLVLKYLLILYICYIIREAKTKNK